MNFSNLEVLWHTLFLQQFNSKESGGIVNCVRSELFRRYGQGTTRDDKGPAAGPLRWPGKVQHMYVTGLIGYSWTANVKGVGVVVVGGDMTHCVVKYSCDKNN